MGESIVAGSSEEAKMGKTGAANPTVEESVSFGRFENDSLSWEKWSSFSQNKYLEEVGKYATPGSVASKKAYFEAHYKKIAARKAELQDEVQQMGEDYTRSVVQSKGELISKTSRADSIPDEAQQMGEYYPRSVVQSKREVISKTSRADSVLDEPVSQTSAEVVNHVPKVEDDDREGTANNHNNYTASEKYGQYSTVGEVKAEYDGALEKDVLSNLEEAASLNIEVSPSEGSDDMEELPQNLKEENKPQESIPFEKVEALSLGHQDKKEIPKKLAGEVEKILPLKKDIVKPGHPTKVSHKTVPMSKVREVTRGKMKSSSPATKVPQVSTPKVSKPVSASADLSASRFSTKKMASSLLPRNKIPSASRGQQAAIKSLHMSISLDAPPPSSDSVPTTARQPLIMEKMKDKDIIKRAFKTFQSDLSRSTEARASVVKQTPAKWPESKASSTNVAPRKVNGGSRMLVGMEKKNAKAAPASLGTERDERPEKRREPLYFGTPKKLEEKSISRKAESAPPQAKTKERQGTEIKKLRQGHNFKATPMPAFYRSSKVTNIPLHKEGSKTFGL